MERTWKPTTAGILNLISGVIVIGAAIILMSLAAGMLFISPNSAQVRLAELRIDSVRSGKDLTRLSQPITISVLAILTAKLQ